MQYVYYTIAAITLYFLSDWIVRMIEKKRGKAFEEQRSLVFLAIIMALAITTFKIIELMVNN